MKSLSLAFVVVLACNSACRGADATDAQAPQEMAALEQMLGSWDVEDISEEGTPREAKSTGTAKYDGTLDGRYVQSQGFNEKGNLKGITMYTYHLPSKQYRLWYFGSTGLAEDATGKWDAKTNTFTFVGDTDTGGTWKFSVRIVGKDACERKFILFDKDGKETWTMNSKMSRK